LYNKDCKEFKEQKMKIAVIICEYNPLQKGHVYHISRAIKDTGAQKVICIMSGNFTQRGELAIADKYTRATWAIKNGADMVVELPPQHVLTTAKYFALGGVKIADLIKGEVTLSFGSELGNLQVLQDIASFQEDDAFKTALHEELKKGNGYAKSYATALSQLYPDYADTLTTPNNILAVEYLKALNVVKSAIAPHTLARVGGGYHQTTADEYPSASAIRIMWQKGDLQTLAQGVPQCVYDYLKNTSPTDWQDANDKMFALLKFNVNNIDLKNIHGVKEGVENRIITTLKESDCWQELVDKLATKRYTNSYLLRTLINILISNTFQAQDLQDQNIDFINVLAIEKNCKDLLSAFDCRVITKSSDLPNGSLIKRADILYSSVTKNIPQYMQIVSR
ncbi:MAG: nucleotidyltransferase family protein, partial [Clostridia bacterium]|nr:nucleotidyltransferase family protein [Clostridia bacterium]